MEFRDEIPVTYSDGVFRPDREVSLPDGSHGFVRVPTEADDEKRRKAWELLDRIQREKLIVLRGPKITREELYDDRIRH